MSDIEQQFLQIADTLSAQFPELDLRFNLKGGSSILRFKAAVISTEVFELPLGTKDTNQLIQDATFLIKEIARLFDD